MRRFLWPYPLLSCTAVTTGNVLSAVSVLLLLVACSEPKWAHDTVNSVDIGLWYLTVRVVVMVAAQS